MIVIRKILPLDGINNGKIHLDSTSLPILKDFRTFIFKPMLYISILMKRYTGYVCFSLLGHPVYPVFRTLIIGDSSQPIIYN